MIVEYESPLKKLGDDFGPHAKVMVCYLIHTFIQFSGFTVLSFHFQQIGQALMSLAPVYMRRSLTAEQVGLLQRLDGMVSYMCVFVCVLSR